MYHHSWGDDSAPDAGKSGELRVQESHLSGTLRQFQWEILSTLEGQCVGQMNIKKYIRIWWDNFELAHWNMLILDHVPGEVPP